MHFPVGEETEVHLGHSTFLGTARSFIEQRHRTNETLVEAAHRILERESWWDGTPLDERHREMLTGWVPRLDGCATEVLARQCVGKGHVHVQCYCCRVPACPLHQKRLSGEWLERAVRLYEHLPDGAVLQGAEYGWRMVTVGIRPLDTFEATIEALIKLRADLFRFLAGRHGLPLKQELEPGPTFGEHLDATLVHEARVTSGLRDAGEDAPEHVLRRFVTMTKGAARVHGFGSIEMSETGYLHLHCLVYSRFIQVKDREQYPANRQADKHKSGLQTWLKKRTATERHPEGSWYIDIRRVYDKQRGRDSVPSSPGERLKALQEAIKYASAPVGAKVKADGRKAGGWTLLVDADGAPVWEPTKDGGRQWKCRWETLFDPARIAVESTENQLHGAERILRLYAALYRRHRVQPYGLAVKRLEGKVAPQVARGVTTSEAPEHVCPHKGADGQPCGAAMHVVLHGTKNRWEASYAWSGRARPRPRRKPGPLRPTTAASNACGGSGRPVH